MCKVRACLIDYPDYELCHCGEITKVKGPKWWRGTVSQHKGNGEGHFKVHLQSRYGKRDHVWVHRVICAAFHGTPPVYDDKEAEVRHLDDDPGNNHANNLRWGSRTENERDKWRSNTH